MFDENRWSGEKALEYDSMIEECRNLTDNAQRMEIFAEAEKLLMEEMPIMPLYFRNTQLLVKPTVSGLEKNLLGHTMFVHASK